MRLGPTDLLIIVFMILWVIALIDAIRAPADQLRRGNKTLWVLLIFFTAWTLIGAILYLLLARPIKGTAHPVQTPVPPAQATETGTWAMAEPGWYQDPSGSGQLRWWDGSWWTDRTVAPQPAPPPVDGGTSAPPSGPAR